MRIYNRPLTLISLIVMILLVSCTSNNQSRYLLEFLDYIPDNEIYRQWITYGDLSAWFDAWGIDRPKSGDILEIESSDFSGLNTVTVLDRQTQIPQSFDVEHSLMEDQIGLLGFNFLTMDRYAEAGYPPSLLTIADFSFDRAQIGDALTKLGYQSDKDKNGILYSIRNDYEADYQSPVISIQTPNLNRILLTNGRMVIGAATEVVEHSQSTHANEIPSLAENDTYIALSQAIGGDILSDVGQLVGIILINGPTLNHTINQRLQDGPDGQSENYFQHSIPDFDLAGFATYQDNKTSFLTLILVFPKDTDALSSADILAERLQNYTTLDAGVPYKEWWTVEKASVSSINGLPVAIVVMKAEARESQGPLGNNLNVLTWSPLIFFQDILFLKT